MEQKRVLCSSCDIYCQVVAEVEDGRVVRVKAADPRPLRANICMKGVHAAEGFRHHDRVLHPLRRAGERGSGRWEQVSWDAALDDIAQRLGSISTGPRLWPSPPVNGTRRRRTARDAAS